MDDESVSRSSGTPRGGITVGHFAILLHVDAAAGGDARGELRAHCVEDRAQALVEQVRGDPTGIIPILAPAEVALGAERALRRRASHRADRPGAMNTAMEESAETRRRKSRRLQDLP